MRKTFLVPIIAIAFFYSCKNDVSPTDSSLVKDSIVIDTADSTIPFVGFKNLPKDLLYSFHSVSKPLGEDMRMLKLKEFNLESIRTPYNIKSRQNNDTLVVSFEVETICSFYEGGVSVMNDSLFVFYGIPPDELVAACYENYTFQYKIKNPQGKRYIIVPMGYSEN